MNPLTPYLWLIKLAAAALLIGAIMFGVWLYGHKRYEAGIAAQRAAESKSLAIYTKSRDAQLASAEASYHAEIDNLRLHPVSLGPLRLCINMPGSTASVAAEPGPLASAPAPAQLRAVPSGGNSVRQNVGPDFGAMQQALAMGADRVLAIARFEQKAAH